MHDTGRKEAQLSPASESIHAGQGLLQRQQHLPPPPAGCVLWGGLPWALSDQLRQLPACSGPPAPPCLVPGGQPARLLCICGSIVYRASSQRMHALMHGCRACIQALPTALHQAAPVGEGPLCGKPGAASLRPPDVMSAALPWQEDGQPAMLDRSAAAASGRVSGRARGKRKSRSGGSGRSRKASKATALAPDSSRAPPSAGVARESPCHTPSMPACLQVAHDRAHQRDLTFCSLDR